MATRALTVAAMGAFATLFASPAHPQRRDHGPVSGAFRVALSSPVRFGDVVVPAREYRLTLSDAGFALADAYSMVLVATVPVEQTTGHVTVTPASVEVSQHGQTVTILMQYADRVYKAVGTATEIARASGSRVVLAGKTEKVVEAKRSGVEATDLENVIRALKRYSRSLQHCAEAAHRSRWRTDDPRFIRCVCPIIEKWRLPKVSAPLRVHRPLAKGRSGYSFTATVEGKVTDCRVWIGVSPQLEKGEKPTAEPPQVDTDPTPPQAKATPEAETDLPPVAAEPVPASVPPPADDVTEQAP